MKYSFLSFTIRGSLVLLIEKYNIMHLFASKLLKDNKISINITKV